MATSLENLTMLMAALGPPRTKYDHLYGGYCDPAVAERIDKRKAGNYSEEDRSLLSSWRTASTYAEVLELNRAFLRGDVEFSPFFCGPIHYSTLKSVPELLRLRDYGLFTTSSSDFFNRGPEFSQCDCCPDFAWFHSMGRPYLTFIMPRKDQLPVGSKLVGELMRDVRIFTSVWNGEKGFDNFPPEAAKWETGFTKKAHSKDDISTRKAQNFPRFFVHPRDPKLIPQFIAATGKVLGDNPLQINVLMKAYENVNVFELVEQAAVRAGMKRRYGGEVCTTSMR